LILAACQADTSCAISTGHFMCYRHFVTRFLDGNQATDYPALSRERAGSRYGIRRSSASPRLRRYAPIAMARIITDARRGRWAWPQTGGEFRRNRSAVRGPTHRSEAAGLPAAAAQSIALGKSLELAAAELDHVKEEGASLIVPGDVEYPRRLLEIYDPPLVLYLKGSAELIDKPGIAIVGTRHPTPYGTGMAERLACDLAARGLVVFSGMARGIDTAAHRGALNAHGHTVAIWGTGIDEVYPRENRKISDQILTAGGAILTEFPLGTFPATQNFP